MKRISFIVAVLCSIVSGIVQGTPTENRQIRVLPAPGPVVIDGAIDDWDLSGGTFGCSDVEHLRDTGSVWFHLMHDDEAFYILARFRDRTPLNNPHVKAQGQGWGGDCLQVRMITDQTLHMTAWRDAEGISVMDIYYGTFGRDGKVGEEPDALAAGARMAFQIHEDGAGYNQEIALPWSMVTRDGKPMPVGEAFRVTWEGRLERAVKVADLYSPNPDRIFTFRATGSWGRGVMVGENGVAPAPLLLADGRQFDVTMVDGRPRVDWSGLLEEDVLLGHIPITFELASDSYVTLAIDDADGNRVRNLVSSRYLTAGEHTLLWDGLRDGQELDPGAPVEPGTYRWRGLARGALNLVYRGHYHNEGEPPWSNFQSHTDWGGDHGRPTAAVSDGRQVYLGWTGGEASTQLIAVNPRTFRKVWGARRMYSGNQWLAIDGKDLYSGPNRGQAYAVSTEGTFQQFEATGTADLPMPEGLRPAGLVVVDGLLYFSDHDGNALAVVDPADGSIVRRIAVASPGRLARRPDAPHIWAISAGGVVRIDPADGSVTEIVTDGLSEPRSLTVGPDGTLYVADWGDSHQVKVFDAEGRFLRAIGRAGGRAPHGPWDATAFINPEGLTVGPLGRVWVGEAHDRPRRWSVWTPEGELVRELFGPAHYGADGGALHPRDPFLGVGMQSEWRVDPDTGRGEILGVITSDEMTNVPLPLNLAHSSRYLEVGGRTYLAQGLHRYYSMLKMFRRDGDGDFAFISAIGNGFEEDPRRGPMPYTEHPLFEGRRGQLFAWSDLNGDGLIQADELQFRETSVRILGGWQHLGVNRDFEAYFQMSDRSIWRFPVSEVTADGTPVYDLEAAGPVYRVAGGGRTSFQGVMPGHAGTLALVSSSPLQAFDTGTGERLWTYPNDWAGVQGSHRSPRPAPGLLRGVFAVIGNAYLNGREFFMLNSNVGEWHCITGDGLHVANLFTGDQVRMQWPDQATPGVLLNNAAPGMGGEDFGGFFTGTDDGRAFIQAGKTGFWIVELTGLDSIVDLAGGTIEQSEDGIALSRDWQSQRKQQAAGLQRYAVTRGTPVVDGNLDDWSDEWLADYDFARGQPTIRSGLRYDDDYLYLAFQVQDPSPWRNRADVPEDIYVSGDTVDLQIGIDPEADPDRARAVQGDQRVSIGLLGGEPRAVLFREQGPRAADGRRMQFSSGVIDEFWVESVSVIEDARIEVTRAGRSYTLEAAIPLSALDLDTHADLALRGDMGVTFSNSEGTAVMRRAYWSNRNVGIVNDVVFELRLEPRNWGILTFK